MKNAHVIYLHLLRENGCCIGASWPVATNGNIKNEEEWLMKLAHVIGSNINNPKLHVVNQEPYLIPIPNQREDVVPFIKSALR